MAQPIDIESLVNAHAADLWRYLRLLGCDDALADDLRQETFLYVLRNPIEDFGLAATGAYLRRTAKNRFIDAKRKSSRVVPLSELSDIEHADETWEETCAQEGAEPMLKALRKCLSALDGESRSILELRYRDEMDGEEMARTLSTTLTALKSKMQRAKATLRACVEKRMKRGV